MLLIPVRELLKPDCCRLSSNVATLSCYGRISTFEGTVPTDFVHLMNQKSAELGMTNTTYYTQLQWGRKQVRFNGLYQMQGIDLKWR